MHNQHIDVYYDEVRGEKWYRHVLNGEILPLATKNQIHFKPNVVITTYPLHDSNSTFMITSDTNKALKSGVEFQNVFNSIADMRNHIDASFGQTTIIRMNLQFEHNVHNAVNHRFDKFQARLVALQRQVECQEKELTLVKSELYDLKNPKKADVSCCDLLSLDEDKTDECNLHSTTNKSTVVIEY
jgi:hypothetical protein